MATEPVDGILHVVTNDAPIAGSVYGAQAGALTSKFSVWMAIPQHHDRITVINAQMPKTYYLFNSGAYTFTLTVDDGKGTDVVFTFDITQGGYGYGNYSSTDFLAPLNADACWSKNGAAYGANPAPGTWTIGTYSRRYICSLSGFYILKSTQGISGLTSHMARYMGFPYQTEAYNSGYSGGTTTLNAPYVINFTLTNVINICCDVGQEDVPAAKGNCIGRIYMGDTGFGAFATLTNLNPYETSRRLQTRELGTRQWSGNVYRLVTFSIVDDDGEPIDLNAGHVIMGIYTYARASLYELVRRAANSFAEVAQEQRQVNLAQLSAVKRLRPNPVAESTII